MRENIILFLNNFLSHLPLITLIGLVILLVSQRKALIALIALLQKMNFSSKEYRKSLLKSSFPLIRRFSYILGGYLLVLFSFSIVNYTINLLSPAGVSTVVIENPANFWEFLKFQAQFSGLFAVIIFNLAGISLILSAGNKWLVNVAKILLTFNFFYIFISTLAYFA